VLYRSRPAFRVVPVEPADIRATVPLSEDPIYRAGSVGRSDRGFTSVDHDYILYGKW
jgi:hypothetical protein